MRHLFLLLLILSCSKQAEKSDEIAMAPKKETITITYRLTSPDETTDCKTLTHIESNRENAKKFDGRLQLNDCTSGFSYTLNTYTSDKSCFIDCQVDYNYSEDVIHSCYHRCMKLYSQQGNAVIIDIKAP